jgi:hypothetical protein
MHESKHFLPGQFVHSGFLTSESRNELIHLIISLSLTVKRTVVGLLACSVKMSGSKPKLKVRTLDEMCLKR